MRPPSADPVLPRRRTRAELALVVASGLASNAVGWVLCPPQRSEKERLIKWEFRQDTSSISRWSVGSVLWASWPPAAATVDPPAVRAAPAPAADPREPVAPAPWAAPTPRAERPAPRVERPARAAPAPVRSLSSILPPGMMDGPTTPIRPRTATALRPLRTTWSSPETCPRATSMPASRFPPLPPTAPSAIRPARSRSWSLSPATISR